MLITNVHHHEETREGDVVQYTDVFIVLAKHGSPAGQSHRSSPQQLEQVCLNLVSAGLSHIHTFSPCTSTHRERQEKQKKSPLLQAKVSNNLPESIYITALHVFFFFQTFPYTRTHLLIII